jgi:hypothetical protein
LVGRGVTIYQSPLGEAIDREKISTSFRKLHPPSSHHSWSSSSSTAMSDRRASSGKGKSEISSRRCHSPVPGNEGRAWSSARRHRRATSEGNGVASREIERMWATSSPTPSLGAKSAAVTSIQSSWLSSSPTPQLGAETTQRRRWHSNISGTSTTTTTKAPLRPGEDLIDVSYDEPVDPFSGLIGMSPSIVGCESDDVFGFTTISSSCSSGGDKDYNSSVRSSSSLGQGGGSSGRPPSGKGRRPPKTAIVVEAFDPLLEGGCGDVRRTPLLSVLSPLRPSTTPPRHYKDDPLLANSRYRQPTITRVPSHGQLHQPRPTLTPRSTSLGSGLMGNTVGGGKCLLGTIAQMEVNQTTPMMILGTAPLNAGLLAMSSSDHEDSAAGHQSSSRSLNVTGHSTNTSGAKDDKSSRTTHTTLPLDKSHDENCYYEEEEEDGSCSSFTEEYHRREQKHKGVVREVKHLLKPMVKLFRRGSEGTKLKRADGCLT